MIDTRLCSMFLEVLHTGGLADIEPDEVETVDLVKALQHENKRFECFAERFNMPMPLKVQNSG